MPQLRSIALGTLLIASVVTLAAQDVRDTIGPLEKTAKPSSPENPIPRRTASALPKHPAELTRINGRGAVRLSVTLDRSGRVAEIRKFGEPLLTALPGTSLDVGSRRAVGDAMVEAAAAAVRQWRYETPDAPIVFLAIFNFATGTEPTASQQTVPPVQAARGVSPVPPRPPVPLSPPWEAAERAGAVRLVPGMPQPKPIRTDHPRYSAEAMAAKVQGVVALEILVGTDGKVMDARILQSASPLLNQSAVDAARRWEFTPALVNGEPRPVILMLEFDFNLR